MQALAAITHDEDLRARVQALDLSASCGEWEAESSVDDSTVLEAQLALMRLDAAAQHVLQLLSPG